MSAWFVKVAAFYSKAQIAAMASSKLKFQDPEYYNLLLREKIEMLYVLIEPQISRIMYEVQSGGNNEEVIGDAFYEILKR